MNPVSLLKVTAYDRKNLLDAVTQSIKNTGFNPSDLSCTKIAVKPNLLTSALPESGIITHPEFFKAVIIFIKEHGGIPVLVESPAFLPLSRVMKKTGYEKIVNEEKITVGDTGKTVIIKNDKGIKYKSFHVAEDIIKADFIFNLPKLKTHSLTYFTGAVKNLFGTIHGLEKSKWHIKADNAEDFVSFLLDLYGSFIYLKKNRILNIMDGILGLEGEGPGSGGKAAHAEAVIAGFDAIAVDTVAIKTAGLDINKSRICIEGEKRGLGIATSGEIKIIGAALTDFYNNFRQPGGGSFLRKLPMSSFLKNLLVEKPVPDKTKCTLCCQCKSICPAKAIQTSSDGRIPSYNYKKCIRCYCCMEICPEGAIVLRKKFYDISNVREK